MGITMNVLENYKTSTGRICLMSCISDIFQYYNFDISESIIFALSEGSLFYYMPIDFSFFEDSGEMPLPTAPVLGGMQYDIPKMLQNIVEHFSATVKTFTDIEIEGLKEFIFDNLHAKQPVLSLLSRKHLGYMPLAFRDNVTHSINIIGGDIQNDLLYISDTYIPTYPVTTYQGALQMNAYVDCLKQTKDIFYRSFPYKVLVFERNGNQTDFPNDVSQLMQPLRNMSECYLHGRKNDDGYMIGRYAQELFAVDVVRLFSYSQHKRFSEYMSLIHARITNFGGPVVTHELLSEYIGYMLETHSISQYRQLPEMFRSLSQMWKIVGSLFGKASFTLHGNLMQRIQRQLEQTIELEHEAYGMLRQVT